MIKEAYEATYGRPWAEEDLSIPEKYLDETGNNAIAFPGTPMPVVTLERPQVIQAYHFGFIPHWTAPEKVNEQRATFNARIETITELATWRDAWKHGQRCLVCTNGFFEHNKAEKRKMFIHLQDAENFYYAGLFNNYINKKTGEIIRTMAVVTTTPNALIAGIHNRMPVIIPIGTESPWLDPDADIKQLLAQYTPPFSAEKMIMEYADKKPAKPEQGTLF
jgi:putative SOS response-associated peptidase YedK